jgi:DNA-binding transcriptional ArsR family regulator
MDKRVGLAAAFVVLYLRIWENNKMTPRERLRLTMKAEIFRAIGQPTRLAIMEILHENEMQAGRIAAQLGTDAPNVSKHLALLRKRGLVVDRKQGPNIFYRETIPDLMRYIWCVEKAVQQRLDARLMSNMSPSGAQSPGD